MRKLNRKSPVLVLNNNTKRERGI